MHTIYMGGFPSGSTVVNPLANAEDMGDSGSILGQEDPLEKGMAINASILSWRIS